jgi:type I restriction enzyme, R subunit
MSNFDFLRDCYPSLYQKMVKAESRVFTEPMSAAHYTRLALEEVVHVIYREEQIPMPFDTGLASLMREEAFREVIRSDFNEGLYIVRKTGNAGSHYGAKVRGQDALISIQYLFDFLKWFANLYADREPLLPGAFDKGLIPKVGAEARQISTIQEEAKRQQEALQAKIEALQKKLAEKEELAKRSDTALIDYKLERERNRQELEHKKATRKTEKLPKQFTESETRTHLIDLALREAGWDHLQPGREIEYPVTGMPISKNTPQGHGYADYVLWDDNGLPLAVIEAKRTANNPDQGRHQASLYANAIEAMHGQRPVIFFTNGYRTFIWDDTFYSLPRRVHGFYTKDELQWTIQKRNTRKDIRMTEINKSITGRPYQLEGIQRVAEAFVTDAAEKSPVLTAASVRGAKRHALMVMATGSGKTRVSASIVDILFKNNWIKRVLFLADRNALVTQAKNAFAEHLPDLSSVDLTREKENNTTRLVFSTYQSIINKIDREKLDDRRFYGIGHFDLIIIDEAHRSVYNKFGVIFEYFDSLLLGLTATPKREIDHNTFELFECSDGNPTFSYELDDAVRNKYLVPYKNINLSTNFLREGIRYKDLTEKEKERYEAEFRDNATGDFPEHIKNSALNRWLFNKDTIHKILDSLLEYGLRIEGGDKIGRTIIFAVNQHHADFILHCFEERYHHYPAGYMAVVHNQKSHSDSIILSFCDHHKENLPQIAVSVDMMDTGIDAPRVLNLVFFKPVRSYAKFWQMIGRGTRLCPDIFGVGKDKEYFLIFDVCGNFEFFDEVKHGMEARAARSVTQQIFITRLSVARLLAEMGAEEEKKLAGKYLDQLHGSIQGLDKSRFDVKMKRKYVDEFNDRSRWDRLDEQSIHVIERHLSLLPAPEYIDEKARRFDLMMLKLMQANLLMSGSENRYHENIMKIADALSKKYSIPQVLQSKELIETLRDPQYYKGLRGRKIEEIREEIRELVQYLEEEGREIITTDFEDNLIRDPVIDYVSPPASNELYKKQVERFIRENKHHITISKLNTNQPITDYEIQELQRILFDGSDRGTYEKFKEVYGDQPLGRFIRSIVGLDIGAAQTAFSEFLQSGNLKADQIKFLDNIIQHLNRNGTIDKTLLFEPPFTESSDQGLLGVFDDSQAVRIISLLDGINKNAEVG